MSFLLYRTGKLPPPQVVSVAPGDSENVVTWDVVIGAASYNVYWALSPGVTKSTGAKIAGATSPYTHSSITNGLTYYYVVTAVDNKGESSESGEVSGAPSLLPPEQGIRPDITLTFDDATSHWHEWSTDIGGQISFPLIAWTIRTSVQPRYGEGIMSNGDLVTLNDDLTPNDSILASLYVATGYVDAGYLTESGAVGNPVPLVIRSGQFDLGTDRVKFMHKAKFVGDETENTQTMTIKWADGRNDMNTGRAIDTSKYRKVRQLGRFRRRNFQIEYSGDEVVRLESIEGDLTVGSK